MDETILKTMRDYAWNYFVLHADQRIKTFHFYIILATVISGALLTTIKDTNNPNAACGFAFLLSFLSFVFWKLDKRNRQLIKHGEEALKMIEKKSDLPDKGEEPHRLKLFLYEEYTTSYLKRFPHNIRSWSAHFSYSTCFNAVFCIFGFAGFVAGLILILKPG